MSYRNPLENVRPKSAIYSDVSTNMRLAPTNRDVARLTETEAVKRAVRNLILTDKYERLLNPSIGGNIKDILFEPMIPQTAVVLQDKIEETLKNYEPRIDLRGIIVEPDYDRHAYYVQITFSLVNRTEISSIELFLNRIR